MLEENNMNMIENNNINSFSKLISNVSDLDNNKPNLMPNNYQFYFDNLQVTKKGNFIEDFNKIYRDKKISIKNISKNDSKYYNSSTNQSSNYIKTKNEKVNPLKSPEFLNQNIKYEIKDNDINKDKQKIQKKKDNKLESSCCNIF